MRSSLTWMDHSEDDRKRMLEVVATGLHAMLYVAQRYVPALPLSREVSRLEGLKQSLVLYRMVFGQPRQEDLVRFLEERDLARGQLSEMIERLSVDVAPSTTPALPGAR